MWCNPLLWCWLLNQHSKVVQWLQQKKRQKEKKKVPFRNVFFFFFFFLQRVVKTKTSQHRQRKSQGICLNPGWDNRSADHSLISEHLWCHETGRRIHTLLSMNRLDWTTRPPHVPPREGASTKGERRAALTPRSPTAASWRTCGSLGRWTPPRAAGRGAASRWSPGRSPGVAARRPDPDAGLRSPAPHSLESTGAPCRSAAGTAWWGLGRGNVPGKPDRKDKAG